MADNQIQIFVPDGVLGIAVRAFGRKPTSNGPLIECVPNHRDRHLWRTRNASHLVQFIHHARVGNKGTAAGQQGGQLGGYQATQVTGMLAQGMGDVVEHGVVHLIDTTCNRLEQPTTTDDGIKTKRDVMLLERSEYQLLAELKLVDDARKGGQFFYRVTQGGDQQGLFIGINRNLCRGGTGIDG